VCKRNLINVFYHILQVAAHVVKSVVGVLGFLCWKKGGRMGSAMVSLERAMMVSNRLAIVTVVLSLTIRLQVAQN